MIFVITGDGTSGGDGILRRLKERGLVEKELVHDAGMFEWSATVVGPEGADEEINVIAKAGEFSDLKYERFSRVKAIDKTEDDVLKERADQRYIDRVLSTAEQVGRSMNRDIHHQMSKYGAQRVDGFGWLAILTEEFGETAQAYLKKDYSEAIAEAKQTIACLSRFITEVEREQTGLAKQEAQWYERAK